MFARVQQWSRGGGQHASADATAFATAFALPKHETVAIANFEPATTADYDSIYYGLANP